MRKVIIFGVDGLVMPLLKQFASEGSLPHINTMLKKGSSTELLPFISAWGDVNWVSFLTGQCPGTSWIRQCMPPDNTTSQNLLYLLERAGLRAALVHFPESISARAPHFEMAPYWGRKGQSPYEISAPAMYSTLYEERNAKSAPKRQKLGWPPAAALAYHEKGNCKPIVIEAGEYRFQLANSITEPITVTAVPAGDELLLRLGNETTMLRIGKWSEWVPVSVNGAQGYVRFFLGKYIPEDGSLEILQSQVLRSEGLSNDPVMEAKLMSLLGPFISKWTAKITPQEEYLTSAVEEAEYQSLWLADSATHLTRNCGISLWATVHRLVDEAHHNCLGQYDPASPFYKEDTAAQFGEVIRECYKVLDRTIGRIMETMDDETTLLLVSDHGGVPNSYMCDINRYLAMHDLVKLDSEGNVIIEESRVYLKDERGGLEIYINLLGREPKGIVPQTEYELLREKVLRALGNWHIEDNGQCRNAVSIALKKEDAVGIGYWGEYAGDIVFAYNTGFVWGVSATGEDICPVEAPGANHGPQKPTAQTAVSSNYGVLLAYGKAIRAGYHRDKAVYGPHRMVDPGATIAKLLGLTSTTLDGTIMDDFIKIEGDKK